MSTTVAFPPRPRVVVVDDDTDVLTWSTAALQPAFQVVTTSSVTALPGILAYSGRPTLVLVDPRMPALNGLGALRSLVEERPPDTWFFIHSAARDDEAAALLRDCGADGFVPKGGAPGELRAALQTILARRSRRLLLAAGTEAARLIPDRAALTKAFDVLELRSIKMVLRQFAVRPPHVIIGSGPLIDGRVEELYDAIRGHTETRRISILHLAAALDGELISEMRAAGANLVMSAATAATSLTHTVHRLAHVAPRRDVRVPLQVNLGAPGSGPHGTTRNVSVSGLLATFDSDVELGGEVAVAFSLPNRDAPIAAATRVIRGQSIELEQYVYGLQFTSLSEQDFDAIAAYVAKQMRSPAARKAER